MTDQPPPAARPSPFRALAQETGGGVDPGHVQRLVTRVAAANQNGVRAREEIRRTRRELARVEEGLRHELAVVRAELAALRTESDAAVSRVESLVGQFRSLSRAGDFARLRDRADAWAPHSRITREQFQKLLDAAIPAR